MKRTIFNPTLLATIIVTFTLFISACSHTSESKSDNENKEQKELLTEKAENDNNQPNKEIKKIEVVDFSATWCPPCQELAPYFEKWANTYKDYANFEKIDIDQNQMEAEENGIEAIPTVIIRDPEGNEIKRIVGFEPEEMEQAIKTAIDDAQGN